MNQVEIEESGVDCLWEMNYEPGDPECKHPLPADWYFTSAVEGERPQDPRADPRWRPVTYVFMDRKLHAIHITSEPQCDHVAKGSYKKRLEKRLGIQIFYITGAPEGRKGTVVWADPDGALG